MEMTTLQVSEDADWTKTKRIYYCYYIFYKSGNFSTALYFIIMCLTRH